MTDESIQPDLSKINILQKGIGETKFSGKSLLDIYYRTLTHSNSWDQALGYFRLSAMKLLAFPLSKFIIQNNGRMRIYCNEQLSESDYSMLCQSKKYELKENDFFTDIYQLNKALQGTNERLFADCIAFLIQQKRLEVKVLIKVQNSLGIAHEKNGIFKDNYGNVVVFTGSANASEQALLFNKEDTTAFCSFWEEWSSTKTINTTIEMFERTYMNGDEEWKILEVDSEELKEKLQKIGFAAIDESEIVSSSRNFAKHNKQIFSPEIHKEIDTELMSVHEKGDGRISQIIDQHTGDSRFEFPMDRLRPYQNEAIRKWQGNNCKGIMAMATGTGKTYVAFGLIHNYLKDNPDTIIFICCPYQHLIEQWGSEIESFGVKPVLVYAKTQWREKLIRKLRQRRSIINPLFIIATNNSLLPESDFSKIMSSNWAKTFFIADEAHNVGSGNLRRALPLEPKIRLGLSATIDRYFDELGTNYLLEYFGGVVYEFSLKEAIGKYLVHYDYFAYPVPLTEEEFQDYLSLSAKISSLSNLDDAESEEIMKNLLNKRARIANNSRNKIEWLRANLEDNQEFAHTLFYVGDEIFQDTIDLLSFEKNVVAQGFFGETTNRMEILQEFDAKVIKCLVAMKCLDEGVNVPAIKTAYFLASSGNPKEFVQRRGRILRESKITGKEKATIYDLVSVPPKHITKASDVYQTCRSAFKSQFKRIKEFASLADNKYSSLEALKEEIEKYNLYTEI